MGFGNIFKLAHLKIEGFKTIDRLTSDRISFPDPLLRNPLEVPYNPETLSSRFETSFSSKRAAGPKGDRTAQYAFSRGHEMTVKLVFDGTDVSFLGVEKLRHIPSVRELVENFLRLCHTVQGETHEPSFLRVTWGDCPLLGKGFDCRLQSCDIQYTLFDRDGSPLRAELTVKFVEARANTPQELRLSSPDLTHRRVVVAGDTLPALCQQIYGSAVHYLRVARINDLDDPRNLIPGQELRFPPFARGERG